MLRLLPVALLLAGRALAAPTLPADTTRPAPATAAPAQRFSLGLATANRTVYLQRAPLPTDDYGYLGTTLTYQAPSGFMASGYLNHSYASADLGEPFINFGEAVVGWQSTGNGSWYWSAQYAHLFSYGESALVQASLSNDLSASLTHYFDYLTASAQADLFLGGTRDLVLTFDLSHQFQLPSPARDTLTIEPTLEFGAGSQHFYANSLGKTSVVKRKKRAGGGTTTLTDVPASPGFAALGFTLSAPINYQTGRFTFTATPAYLIPLNVPTGGVDSSTFYGTLGVEVKF